MVKNLMIVSNRLPVNIKRKGSQLIYKNSIGGLAVGLGSLHKLHNSKWVGWPGIDLKRIKKLKIDVERKLNSEFNCYPVFLSQQEIVDYYQGFCNNTIWPHFHYFNQYTIYNDTYWEAYKQVNLRYCDKIMEIMTSDDYIWIHDFHLMLLPQLIRKKSPDATIGFFLHIPFPSSEIYRLLPWRKEILEGILGADLIGFHTYDYARHFLSSIYRVLGLEAKLGQINMEDRVLKIDIFPMGINYEKFFEIQGNLAVQEEVKQLKEKIGNRKTIFSIDRLDYTKGIPQRLEAFDLFLRKYPEFRNKVIYICVVVPSRTKVEKYQLLKKQMDELIGKLNGDHGEIGWAPVWYLYRQLPFRELAALYSMADIALITPYRDGMNLIAKEFIATKVDGKGVLILSEGAGAAKELGEALIVNPNNKEEIVDAIQRSLTMGEEEQIKRNRRMQFRLQRYNVIYWADEFISSLESVKSLQKELLTRDLSKEREKRLIHDYLNSKSRLILLDYDGTLREYFDDPAAAKPTDEILELLQKLAADKKNSLVLISGRIKGELNNWFKELNINMVAEHGVWIKELRNGWKIVEPLQNDWKEGIRPIFELFTDRTPGSFIEEKEFSLAWHFRKVDPEMGEWRARELVEVLVGLTANFNLQILEGSKVIEIKNSGINKGRAALLWIEKKDYDFIIATGDDWTDEDTFEVLPEKAYSIKVGPAASHAKFRLKNPHKMRLLLKNLTKGS